MVSWMRRFFWLIVTCGVATITPCACVTPVHVVFSPKALSAHVTSFPFLLFISVLCVLFLISTSSIVIVFPFFLVIPVIYVTSIIFIYAIFLHVTCVIFLNAIFALVITFPYAPSTLDRGAIFIRALFFTYLNVLSFTFTIFPYAPFIISTCATSLLDRVFLSIRAISAIFLHVTSSPFQLFAFIIGPFVVFPPFRAQLFLIMLFFLFLCVIFQPSLVIPPCGVLQPRVTCVRLLSDSAIMPPWPIFPFSLYRPLPSPLAFSAHQPIFALFHVAPFHALAYHLSVYVIRPPVPHVIFYPYRRGAFIHLFVFAQLHAIISHV